MTKLMHQFDIFNPDDEELLSESLSPTMTVASKEHDSGDKDATCFKKISKDLSPNPSSNDNRLKSDDGMITNAKNARLWKRSSWMSRV